MSIQIVAALRLAAFAALCAVTAGCVHETAGTVITTDTRTGAATVLEDSTRLRDRVQVTHVAYDEVNGLKRVTITLASTRHNRQRLQARIVWLNADGTEIDADAKPYRTYVLGGRDSVTVTGVAPNPSGVVARMRVRDISAADRP